LHKYYHFTYKTHINIIIEALFTSYLTINKFKSFIAAKRNELSIYLNAYNKVKAHVSDFKKTCKACYKDITICYTLIRGDKDKDKDKDKYNNNIIRDIRGKVINS
jgi:hypothetical protein